MKKLVIVVAAIAALQAVPKAAHADILSDLSRSFEEIKEKVTQEVDHWQARHGVKEPMDAMEYRCRRWWDEHFHKSYERFDSKETPSTTIDGHTQCPAPTKHPISEPGGFENP